MRWNRLQLLGRDPLLYDDLRLCVVDEHDQGTPLVGVALPVQDEAL